jgi:hypothetical protein
LPESLQFPHRFGPMGGAHGRIPLDHP